MKQCSRVGAVLIMLSLLPAAALAQTSGRPDPADPALPVAAPRYESALQGYRPYELKLAPWKSLNDEMGRLGGHAGHQGAAAPAHGGQRAADQGAPAQRPDHGSAHKH